MKGQVEKDYSAKKKTQPGKKWSKRCKSNEFGPFCVVKGLNMFHVIWASELGSIFEAMSWVWFSHHNPCPPTPTYRSSNSFPSPSLPQMGICKSTVLTKALGWLQIQGGRRTQTQPRDQELKEGAPGPVAGSICIILNCQIGKELPEDRVSGLSDV